MNIRFIDTSIVMNLLRIPHMCQEYESVKKEFNEAIEQNEYSFKNPPSRNNPFSHWDI